MPESGCFLCGQPTREGARVCSECAARFSDAPIIEASPPLRLEQESPQRLEDALEEMSQRRLGESSRYRSHIPLPPQMREEQERRERSRAEEALRQATVENAGRLAARREKEEELSAPKATSVQVCPNCGEQTGQEGVQFSICLHCGTELPGRVRPKTRRRRKDTQGVRDMRGPVRELADLHRQAARHQTQAQTEAPPQTSNSASPLVHAALSFLLPGLGQLLNRQVGKGVLLLVGSLMFTAIVGAPGMIVRTIVAVISAIDAYRIAERRQRGEEVGPTDWDLS